MTSYVFIAIRCSACNVGMGSVYVKGDRLARVLDEVLNSFFDDNLEDYCCDRCQGPLEAAIDDVP